MTTYYWYNRQPLRRSLESTVCFFPGVVYFPKMHDRQARAILEARVEAGGKLVVGQEADWISIKRLQIQCHEAGVPTVLGNCPSGG